MKINKTLLFSLIGFFQGVRFGGRYRMSIRTDAQQLGKWFSEELAHATAVNALSGPNCRGRSITFSGLKSVFRRCVSSSKLDLDSLKTLPWTELQPEGFDMPSDVIDGDAHGSRQSGAPFQTRFRGQIWDTSVYDDTEWGQIRSQPILFWSGSSTPADGRRGHRRCDSRTWRCPWPMIRPAGM
jgi:hypothetical protein